MEQVTSTIAGQMLDVFFAAGHRDVDTALMYANGETEKMLGELLQPGSDRLARSRIGHAYFDHHNEFA